MHPIIIPRICTMRKTPKVIRCKSLFFSDLVLLDASEEVLGALVG